MTVKKDRHSRETGARMAADQQVAMRMIQLLCGVSMLRTALMLIAPAAGCSAWWTALACMLPGLGATLLWLAAMGLTGASTPVEAARCALGRTGGWLLSALLGAGLLLDGAASLTALVTMFTQGIGARGTQFTMALLTTGVLLCCLHPQGLPRGISLLMRAAWVAAGLLIVLSLSSLRPDGLLPLPGESGAWRALAAGPAVGIGWPYVLLAGAARQRGIGRSAALPASAVTAALLFTVMLVPHEQLLQTSSMADQMLLPTMYVASGARMLGQCLWMLLLFLALGSAVLLGVEHLGAPLAKKSGYLPGAALAALTLTQLAEPSRVMAYCLWAQGWLPLLLLAEAGLVCLLALPGRRKGGRHAKN